MNGFSQKYFHLSIAKHEKTLNTATQPKNKLTYSQNKAIFIPVSLIFNTIYGKQVSCEPLLFYEPVVSCILSTRLCNSNSPFACNRKKYPTIDRLFVFFFRRHEREISIDMKMLLSATLPIKTKDCCEYEECFYLLCNNKCIFFYSYPFSTCVCMCV